ncbi:MAG: hypothetical protein NTW64_01230 [Candidatus Omnitrophica bacterium]|nr:hypothetical protein [Candidatus Omnitrophota bacterium]
MKKLIFITLMAFLLVPALAFSEEQSPATDTTMEMSKGMEMGKGMEMCKGMGKGMRCDCGKMCMMMQKQMIATSDGGVIVLAGNKLYKYDKNLNLVKEAEIKMDVEGMKKMMEQMKEKKMQMMQEEKSEPAVGEKESNPQ